MPRNRSARLAVLASVAKPSASTPYSSRASSALRRRAVVTALVLVSLALITVYFRESGGGRLHGVQGAAATALRPFEVAADRIAEPFRDAYGYFADMVHAKGRVDDLERENSQLREAIVGNQVAEQENATLREMLRYKAPPALRDIPRVNTEVIAQPQSQFDKTITIGAGANDGIHRGNPVLDPDGNLVGTVELAFSTTALVTLLTDETSAVAARDPATGAKGIIKHAQGTGNMLVLDRVGKDERVREFDYVITSGFKWRGLSSLYPEGIKIGWVNSASQRDTDLFKRVQVTPYADFDNLEAVMVVAVPEQARGLP